MAALSIPDALPDLRREDWEPARATLHMWSQIVGKVRLARTPLINHWWNVTLYVTSRGLTTSPIPHDARSFQIDFDFLDHELRVGTSAGGQRRLPLAPRTVADFYEELMRALGELGVPVRIWTAPQEIEGGIPFERDEVHAEYDPEAARRFWEILVWSDRVLNEFRSGFLGKCSPVHFFWGAFDLAVTRFSGRRAPEHPGGFPALADRVTREAYSHECSSAGFWPGGGPYEDAAFYAYAYPSPDGFGERPVEPDGAFYAETAGEYLLPYDAVRTASDPAALLHAFLRTTYEAAAELADWDRSGLERPGG